MITIVRATKKAVAESRRAYLAALGHPVDGMWAAFAEVATPWQILVEDRVIGHLAVDEDDHILQFHVEPGSAQLAREAFTAAVTETGAVAALVSTFEPWLPLCLDHQQEVGVHTLLYRLHDATDLPLEDIPDLRFEPVIEAERERVETFVRGCFDHDLGDWLEGYLHHLVERGELYELTGGGTTLGTGELRVNDRQPPAADLGVIVAPDHRGRGIASHILSRLVRLATDRGLTPVCSTTIDNLPAQRAIAKAGFIPHHRLLEIHF